MHSDSQPLLSDRLSSGNDEAIPVYYSADGVPISRAEVPITIAEPIHENYGGNYQYSSWHQPEEYRHREENVIYRRSEDEFFLWYCICLFFWLLVLIIIIAVTTSVYDNDDYVR